MTPEQIKARCQQARYDIWEKAVFSICGIKYMEATTGNAILESLCREMLATGLEMAAVTLEKMYDESSDREVVFYEALLTGAAKCREQANTLKEPPCDTSSS